MVIERGACGPLEGYFSTREYSLLERLRVVPFFDSDRLVAALLVIDSEAESGDAPPDLSPVEALASDIAARINSARAFLGHGATEMGNDALRSHLTTVMSEAEASGLYVTMARVDLDRVAGALLRNSTTADRYRFKRDLSAALTTMVSGNGELVSIGKRAALLVVQSKNPYSERLLSHQFAQGVRSLLTESPPLRTITERTWRYPGGGQAIDEVIDSILE